MSWEETKKRVYESSGWGLTKKRVREETEKRLKAENELINKHNEIVTSRINGPGPLGVSSLSNFVNAREAKNGGDTEKVRYAKRNAFQTALDYGERAAAIDNLADEYYNKYTISNPDVRNNVERYINAAKDAKETADLYSNYLANTYGTRENAAAIEKNEELDKDIFYKKQEVNRYESGLGRVPTKYKDRVQKTIDSLNEEIAELEAQKTNVPASAETGDKYLAALEEQFAFDKDLDVRDVLSSVDKINALLEKTSDPEMRDYLVQRRAMVMSTEEGVDMTKNYDEDIRVIEEAINDKKKTLSALGGSPSPGSRGSMNPPDGDRIKQLHSDIEILENQKARLEQFKSIYNEYRYEHRIRDLLEKGGFSEEEYQTIANLPYIERPRTSSTPRINSPSDVLVAEVEADKDYKSQMSEIEGIYKNSGLTDGEIRELKEYFQDLKNDAEYDEVVERAYRMANDSVEGAVVGSIASVPAGLIGGIQSTLDSVGQWFANLFRDDVSKKPITYKNAANHFGAFSDTVRQTVQENVDWNVGDFDAFDFLYGNLMSTADSALAAGASFVIPGAGQVLLGASAARSTTKDLIDRGVTGGQAVLGGIVAGVFEALFENITIGNIKALQAVKPATWKDSVKNILKSVGVNASEEAATEVANIVYDTVANGSFSDYEIRKQEYINQGMSEEEAANKVALELFGQVLESGASGALMGLTFGSAGSVSASFNMSSIGGRVNGETVRLAKDLASTLDSSSKAYRLGRELSESSSDMFKGSAISEIVNEVYGNQTVKSVADKIEDIGYDGDSESLAREMLKTASSKKLSSSLSRKLDKVSNKNDMYQLWVSLTPESENPSLYETEARTKYGVANGVNKLTANIIMEEISAAERTRNTNEATAEELFSDNSPDDGGDISFEADNTADGSGYGFYGEQYDEQYDERYDAGYNAQNGGETVGEIYNPRSGRVNSDTVSPKVKLKADIQTVKSDTGETVAIERYKGLKDGKIIFQTNVGEADIDSVRLPASLRSTIEYAVQNYDGNTVNTFLKFINGNETAFGAGMYSAYAEAFDAFYNLGRLNYGTLSFENAASLSPESLKFLGRDAALAAYNMGKRVAENERDSVGENKKTPRRTVKRKGEGKYINKASDSSLDEVYLQLAKKFGINIERVRKAGKNVRGQFVPDIMTIVLSEEDSNEYQTMGHELAEFAAEFNPEQMSELYGALMKYALYSAENESDRRAILNIVRRYEREYSARVKKTSYKEASEEYLNNVLGRLLASPSNAERFAAWLFEESGNTAEQNRSILQTLVDLINRIIDKINEFLKGAEFSGIGDAFKNAETRQAKAAVDKFLEILDRAIENAEKASVAEDGGMSSVDNKKTVKFSFDIYDERQRENWKNSKRIILYENNTQFKKFIDDSLNNNSSKKIYFGKISNDLADEIKRSTGIDVNGYNCSLSGNEIRKIINSHGNSSKEALRGQRAINANDILNIPYVILSSDEIYLSDRLYNGKPVINFVSYNNEKFTVSAVVSDKHLDLFVQTAYINMLKNKGNLATPISEQADINTPEASSGTVSNDILSQNDKNVNTNYTRDGEKYSSGENEGNDVRRYGLDFDDGTDIRYSIQSTDDGRLYVKADRQVIKGNNPNVWRQQVYSYIRDEIRHGKDVVVYGVDGDPLSITKNTQGKAIFRNDIVNADGTRRKMTDDEYAVKLRAETHIDELSRVSRRGKEIVPDNKNHSFAKDGFNYRTAYFLDNDGQYYRVTMSVGINGEINTVYNVGKIKEVNFPKSGSKAEGVVSRHKGSMTSIDTTISQNDKNVNTDYMRNNEKYSSDIDSRNIDKNRQSLNDTINGTKGDGINGRYNSSGRNNGGQEQSGISNLRTYNDICESSNYRGRDNSDIYKNREKISIRRVGNRLEITDIEDKDTFSFIEVSEKNYTRDAETAVRLFNAAKVPVYIFESDSMKVFENGKEQNYLFNGVSVGGGQAVLVNNHLVKINGRGIFSHEMFHVGIVSSNDITRKAFAEFNDVVLKNTLTDNIRYKKIVDILFESYGEDISTLSEEYVALISEIIGTDSDWSYYSQMFKNPEAVRRAWAEAFKNYMPEARYSLDIDESLNEEDSDEEINFNAAKGENNYGRENNRENSERRFEILQSGYLRGGNSEGYRKNKGKYERNRTTEGKTRLTYDTGRNVFGYEFENVPGSKMSLRSLRASKLFARAGVEAYVFDPESEILMSKNGESIQKNCNAVTVCGGQVVLISNRLEEGITGESLFAHELLHVYLKSNNRIIRERAEALHDAILKNIIPSSAYYNSILDVVSYSYDNLPNRKFAEEVAAFITANIAKDINNVSGDIFKNPNEVLRAWNNVFSQFNLSDGGGLYSLDIDESLNEEDVRFLIRENEELSELNRYLKEELRLSRGKLTDANEVRHIAATIREEYGSALTVEEIFSALKTFYDSVGEGVFTGDYIDIVSRDIAARILENSKYNREVSEENRAILKEIREYPITFNEEQKREAAYLYGGSFNEYRTRNFGRLRLVNESEVSLDAFWQEMNDKYPWLFDADISPAEMPARLLEAVGALSETYDDPNGLTFEDASYLLATEIKEKYVDSRRSTFADRKKAEREKAVAREKKRGREKLAEVKKTLREEYNGRLREVREKNAEKTRKLRADTKNKLERQQAKYRDMIVRKSSRQKETAEKNRFLRRIRRNVKTLNSLLVNETDARHIPERLKKAAVDFLRCFTRDTSVFTRERLERLNREYARLEKMKSEDYGYDSISSFYDEEINEDISYLSETLDGKRLSELTAGEAKRVSDVTEHFRHIVQNENAVFSENKKRVFTEAAEREVSELGRKREKMRRFDGRTMRFLRQAAVNEQTPVYFFKHMGGVWEEFNNDFLDGQDKAALLFQEAHNVINELKNKYHYGEWINDKNSTFELKTEQGETLTFTVSNALHLYATAKRERVDGQGADHIGGGGVIIRNGGKDVNSVPVRLTPEEVNEVISRLTAEQRSFADAMVRYLSDDVAEWGNETSMKLVGIRKFESDYYIPYTTDDFWKPFSPGRNEDIQRIKNQSFTKRTVRGAKSPIVIGDFVDVCDRHAFNMAKYAALAVPQENMLRLLNYRRADGTSMQSLIKEAYGEEYVNYIRQYLSDVGGSIVTDSRGNISSRLLSLYKKGSVGFSLSVSIQQISSIVRAMSIVNPRYFPALGGNNGMFSAEERKLMSDDYEQLKQHAPVAIIKEIGSFDTGTGHSIADWIGGNETEGAWRRFIDGVDDAGNFLPQFMDRIGWTIIWRAVKRETKVKNPSLTGEALLTAAGRRFRDVINYTQVYDSVFSKSALMRSDNFAAKTLTMFLSEPTVMYNMLIDSFYDYERRVASPGRVISVLVLQIVLNNILRSLVTAPRDDDEEKTLLEKYLGELTSQTLHDLNPVTWVPLGRDIWSMLEGFSVKRPDMSILDTALGIKDIIKDLAEDDYESGAERYGDVQSLIMAVTKVMGLPIGNLLRDTVGLTVSTVFDTNWEKKDVGKQIKYSITDNLSFADFIEWNNKDYEGLAKKIRDGDKNAAEDMYKDISAYLIFYGKDEKSARSSIKSALTRYLKPVYKEASSEERRKIKTTLVGLDLYTSSDIDGWLE